MPIACSVTTSEAGTFCFLSIQSLPSYDDINEKHNSVIVVSKLTPVKDV